jgi:replicative DNA helicase
MSQSKSRHEPKVAGPSPLAPPATPPPTPASVAREEPSTLVHAGEVEPRPLRDLLDDALDRMERRAGGQERPIPLPWPNVAAALGGGLWGGTLVTLVGDTGSGKTQWALQAAIHAAESGVPVCYVSADCGAEQVVARLIALKTSRKWSDLFVGRSSAEDLADLRTKHAAALKDVPFHVLEPEVDAASPPPTRPAADWMRRRYPEEKPGTRPFLLLVDFMQKPGAGRDREELRERMAKAAHEAHQVARERDAVVLFVSTNAREARTDGDESIGIHRDRRTPATLGRGNPARLLPTGKEADVERESDTVIVLAQDPVRGDAPREKWTRVWCAVAKNRAGSRAWCALRFDGTVFEAVPGQPPSDGVSLYEGDEPAVYEEGNESHEAGGEG